MTPLVAIFLGPEIPPGNGSVQATGQVFDNSLMVASGFTFAGHLPRNAAEARELACVCQHCAFGDGSPSVILQRVKAILKRRNQG